MPDSPLNNPEPRWQVILAILTVGGLYLALPEELSVGPRWLQPAIVCILLSISIVTHHQGLQKLNRIVGHILAGTITLFMIWSLALLVMALPSHKENAVDILRSAGTLWLTNILVFAYWFWRLDSGGPHSRALRTGHDTDAFLFPQMTFAPAPEKKHSSKSTPPAPPWSPRFVDYLFISFNNATAFSPTDCPVLSRWAKVLTMIEALISLSTIVLLAARAVNAL